MSKIALSGNASGTGTFTFASPNSNTDRTLTLPDATGTILTTATAGVPVNGPAFRAFVPSTQGITTAVNTKVALAGETFDTASCFNNTGSTVNGIPAYSFMPNVAGYYQVNATIYTQAGSALTLNFIQIFKNGAIDAGSVYGPYGGTQQMGTVSTVLYLNGSTDYISLYILAEGTGALIVSGAGAYTSFSGALVRSAV